MIIKSLKKIIAQMVAGANVATICAMLITGYAGCISPATSPWLTNAGLVFPVFLLINLGFLVFWLLVKPLWALIPFGGMLICFGPIRTYTPFNVPAAPPEGAIKVLSYNVWGFGKEKDCDSTYTTIRYIADSDADIVCWQEASTPSDVEAQLDSLVYPKYKYRDTLKIGDAGGIGILSKFPILGHEHIPYKSEGNLSGAFRLDIHGEEVLVINNHLECTGISLEERQKFKEMMKGEMNQRSARQESRRLIDQMGESSQIRAPQALAVASYIRKHAYQSIICVGDFNDGPLSYTHRAIAKELNDCYVATANGPGISYHLSGFFVRIDNILCSDDWEPYACKVDNSIQSSDHYPIVCWLKKRPGPKGNVVRTRHDR